MDSTILTQMTDLSNDTNALVQKVDNLGLMIDEANKRVSALIDKVKPFPAGQYEVRFTSLEKEVTGQMKTVEKPWICDPDKEIIWLDVIEPKIQGYMSVYSDISITETALKWKVLTKYFMNRDDKGIIPLPTNFEWKIEKYDPETEIF